VKGLTAIARSSLGELSSGGDYSNLFRGFKGVNDGRINKRDVCFNNFNGINGFDVSKFIIKKGWFYKKEDDGGGYYIRLWVLFTPGKLLEDE
jgi:hypothetical protein